MQTKTTWYQILLLVSAIAVLVGFLYLVRNVLPPFVIAFAIAWLLDPLLDKIQRRGCPRVVAIASVYVLFLGAFVLGLVFLVPAIIEQAKQFAQDFPGYAARFKTFAAGWMDSHHAVLVKFKLPTTLEEVFSQYGSQVSSRATSAVSLASNWIASNVSKALWLILIPLVAFYFLTDIDRIRRRSALFIPKQWRDRTVEVFSKVGAVFSSYVRGLLIVCLLYGVLAMIVLTVLQVKYAIILGLLAGILYAVPYIGAFSTVLIVFLVSLATHKAGVGFPFWVPALVMIVQNQVFDLGLTPKILGKSVGLHPVISIFALLAGGQLFGLAGMVLSVPIAASIQEIIFEFSPDLRPEPKKKPKKAARPAAKRKRRVGAKEGS